MEDESAKCEISNFQGKENDINDNWKIYDTLGIRAQYRNISHQFLTELQLNTFTSVHFDNPNN